jgi:predicted SAM-dependent methyltransferase
MTRSRKAAKIFQAPVAAPAPLKLDLGCGPRKAPGFHGVDLRDIPGVDARTDLSRPRWYFAQHEFPGLIRDFQGPWPDLGDGQSREWYLPDASVEEVYSSHFVEHLTGTQRISFFNELYRILKIGGKALVIVPYWSNSCAYGDPTHQWPPMSDWFSMYLNKQWREGDGTPANPGNAPHVGYTCDFDFVNGFGFDERIMNWNQERKIFGITHHLNAARDMHMTLTKNR